MVLVIRPIAGLAFLMSFTPALAAPAPPIETLTLVYYTFSHLPSENLRAWEASGIKVEERFDPRTKFLGNSGPACTELLSRFEWNMASGDVTYAVDLPKRSGMLYSEVFEALRFVDARFKSTGSYAGETLQRFFRRELQLPLDRVTYIVVKGESGKAKAVLRLYDASPDFAVAEAFRSRDAKHKLLLLEHGLQGGLYRLPRRLDYAKAGKKFYAIELGRLAVDPSLMASAEPLLRAAGMVLLQRHRPSLSAEDDVWVYSEGEEKMAAYFQRYGFRRIGGPFREGPNDPDVFVFEASGKEITERFTRNPLVQPVPARR